MNKFYNNNNIGLTYDDVLLVPEKSLIKSRLDVNLSINLSKELKLKYPFMSSAMDTVTEEKMACELSTLGCLGNIHRFQSVEKRLKSLKKVNKSSNNPIAGVAVGLQDTLKEIEELSYWCDIIGIDVAHAYHNDILDFVNDIVHNEILKQNYAKRKTLLMIGSITTKQAAIEFVDCGVDILRIGIGNGSVCSTRLVTGFGVPSLTAIMDVKEAVDCFQYKNKKITIVADGGIRGSSDIAKALAAGADCVMLGSLFAGTTETPGKITIKNGKQFKEYRGMASKEAQDTRGGLKWGTVSEGISEKIPYKGHVKDVVENLAGSLRSSLTYAGAKNLKEFYENTQFVRVTPATLKESNTHILDTIK